MAGVTGWCRTATGLAEVGDKQWTQALGVERDSDILNHCDQLRMAKIPFTDRTHDLIAHAALRQLDRPNDAARRIAANGARLARKRCLDFGPRVIGLVVLG